MKKNTQGKVVNRDGSWIVLAAPSCIWHEIGVEKMD